MSHQVRIDAQVGDVAQVEADVLVVRYASGAAGAVADALGLFGGELSRALPSPGSLFVKAGGGRIGAASAVFFRTVAASALTEGDVQRFSADILRELRSRTPQARHVATTLHGVLLGLDLPRSLRAGLDGWTAALAAGECPRALERITIVSRDSAEVREVQKFLRVALPDGSIAAASMEVLTAGVVAGEPPGRAGPSARFDVFLSFKSEDEAHAREVFNFLLANGRCVFFSRESLPRLGSDEYHARIDEAIEQARHMVVVTSSRAHVSSKWVQYEWRLFLGERLAGRKDGNLITVVAGGLPIEDLPISLRNREVLRCEPAELPRLLEYTRPRGRAPQPPAKPRRPAPACPIVSDFFVAAAEQLVNVSWTAAVERLRAFQLDGLGGWRLPTLAELQLIRKSTLLPADSCYWSSQQAGAEEAFYAHFDDGHVGQGPKSFSSGVCAVFVRTVGP